MKATAPYRLARRSPARSLRGAPHAVSIVTFQK